MRAALAEPGGDPVVLGHDVGDLHPVVRERVAHHVDDELHALGAQRQRRCARAGRLGVEELVGDGEVALVPDLVDEPLHEGVVRLARRRRAGDVPRRRCGRTGRRRGTTPSCCIIPSMSMLIQPSTSLPSFIRKRRVPLHLTGLLVGGMPMKLPVFAACADPTPDDQVALGDDVGEVELEVRERLVEDRVGPLQALRGRAADRGSAGARRSPRRPCRRACRARACSSP